MTKLSADAVVIGGGAAGMMCSLIAARRGLDVILLEPNKMLGRKLRITGKGRCNVTNNCDIKDFLTNIPGDGRFFVQCAQQAFTERIRYSFRVSRTSAENRARKSRVSGVRQRKRRCRNARAQS